MTNIFFANWQLTISVQAFTLALAATVICSAEEVVLVSSGSNSLTNTTTTTHTKTPLLPPVDPEDAYLTTELRHSISLEDRQGFRLATSRPIGKDVKFEIHNVITSDGYILTNHRIPRPGAFPLFLSHGFGCSSRDWLMQRGTNGLAYLLYKAGYDVWMDNKRGNTYSRGHVNPSYFISSKLEYWNFAVDEIVAIDTPANIDYILNATNRTQLGWVGYSIGTTQALAGLIVNPEYQSKVKIFAGLAPVAEYTHCKSAFWRLLSGFTLPEEPLKSILTSFDFGEFLPEMASRAAKILLPTLCSPVLDPPDFCGNSFALLGGFNPKQLDNDMQPVIFGGFPSSTSVRAVVQQLQSVITGANKFRKYNYQFALKNIAKYGRLSPPEYDLTTFRVPTILFAGLNDALVPPEDVDVIVQKIGNIVFFQNVTDPSWSHLDFIFGKQAKQLVYDLLIPQLYIYAPPNLPQ